MVELKRRSLVLGLASSAFAPSALRGQERADGYPTRPITMIVSLAAGSGMDVIVRAYGEPLSQRLGKPVIIDNRPGATNIIAANALVTAPADGYTFLVATSGTVAINPAIFKKLPYDVAHDFVPVSLYVKSPFVLVVNPALPVHSVSDLIAYAKERPGTLNFSSSGIGGAPHLVSEMLNRRFALGMQHVPYKSGPQAIGDVAGGHVSLAFTEAGAALPLVASGQLRAIAVSSATRIPMLPDVPSIAEATGLPDFEAVSWHALIAKTGTPPEIVARMHEEMQRATALPGVREKIAAVGLIPMDSPSVAEMQHYFAAETAKWGALVKSLGLEHSQ